MVNTALAQLICFQPSQHSLCTGNVQKKVLGNNKQGKDVGNRTLCPSRNFSQAIKTQYNPVRVINYEVLKG